MSSVDNGNNSSMRACRSRALTQVIPVSIGVCAAAAMDEQSQSDFDHRCCPNCGAVMRLASVEPRRLHREDDYERHTYRCEACANLSRFVFELPSRTAA
jgi:hypothetical protein